MTTEEYINSIRAKCKARGWRLLEHIPANLEYFPPGWVYWAISAYDVFDQKYRTSFYIDPNDKDYQQYGIDWISPHLESIYRTMKRRLLENAWGPQCHTIT